MSFSMWVAPPRSSKTARWGWIDRNNGKIDMHDERHKEDRRKRGKCSNYEYLVGTLMLQMRQSMELGLLEELEENRRARIMEVVPGT